nr:hypothetical protein [Tanacetum cinerariifolium]
MAAAATAITRITSPHHHYCLHPSQPPSAAPPSSGHQPHLITINIITPSPSLPWPSTADTTTVTPQPLPSTNTPLSTSPRHHHLLPHSPPPHCHPHQLPD